MAPPRKRAKVDDKAPSALLPDFRTAWLVKSKEQSIEIVAQGETLQVNREVLTRQSEYFATCLKPPFVESQGIIRFDDIDPKYLSLYIGVAYCHSSMIPMTPPGPSPFPEAFPSRNTLRELVEVYKLCDRFLSESMGSFILRCIDAAIGDGHRAMFRSQSDEAQQKTLMRDFADGYEALDREQKTQEYVADKMVDYFCEGVSYAAWSSGAEGIADCPGFVVHVSKEFANKLGELHLRRGVKRREKRMPV